MLSRTRRLPARRRSVVESLETRTLLSSHTGTMGEAMFMTSYAALHLRAAQSANAPREPRAERTSTRTTSTRPSALSRIEQSTPPEFLQSLSVVTNADGTSAAIIDYRAIEPGVYAATVRWDNGPAEPALIDQPGEFFHEPLIGSAYALKQLPAGQHTLELTVTHTTTHAAATASATFSIATIEPEEPTSSTPPTASPPTAANRSLPNPPAVRQPSPPYTSAATPGRAHSRATSPARASATRPTASARTPGWTPTARRKNCHGPTSTPSASGSARTSR